ncbi:hypothetical protein [Pantoea cypripedii]|nr:hypothetical protein [Pantoea cypripedii]
MGEARSNIIILLSTFQVHIQINSLWINDVMLHSVDEYKEVINE